MRQKRYIPSKYSEKFEDGVLRADACMDRYSIPRKYQYRNSFEDLPEYSFGMCAVREERRLMRKVYRLMEKGYKPLGSESLESFVKKHEGLLNEFSI